MHILVAIIAAIGSLIWVVVHLLRSANELPEAAKEAKNAVRRHRWSKKSDASVLDGIEDPRDSAAILMAQIASYDGEITSRQKQKMKELMIVAFQADDETAEGLYSYARMVIGQLNDAANSLRKLLRPVMDKLTLEEMKQLVAMLDEMAEVEGEPTERQRQLVMEVRRVLSLDALH
jgi:uncharacterized tellurite resistance protein B-like protein